MEQYMDPSIKTKKQESNRAKDLIGYYQRLKSQRSNFETYWQSLHDYFYIESPDINTIYSAGTELNSNALYDATTLDCADILASGFMNYLTPPTSKWFALRPRDIGLQQSKAVAVYLDNVTDQVNYALNRSNFYNEIICAYKSSGVYGTSVILEEEDTSDDIRFISLPLRQVCIIEDVKGRVVGYFIEFEYTAYQAAARWGEDALSEDMKQELKIENRSDRKYKYLLYIAHRHKRKINKMDKENLPIEAVWLDVENKWIVEESGYNEFPAMTHRFEKRPFIPWGFSPAMKALPFARTLNAIAKTNLRAMMKQTDPPIAVPDNAFIMPFSGNPRTVNYYNKNKMDGSKDIFAFGNYGNPQMGLAAIEYYTNQVRSLMYTDVFLAFDRITKQMNNPEIMERINEKMTLLGPAVGRYIAEIFNPVIIRTIGILARKGKLPPPPEEFIMNPEYEIDCVSQLAQAQRRTELNSLMTGLTLVGQMAQFTPEVLDKVDTDKVVDEAWSILGGAEKVLRDDEVIEKIREQRNNAQAQQAAMIQAQQGADVVKTGAEVDEKLAKAQRDQGGTL